VNSAASRDAGKEQCQTAPMTKQTTPIKEKGTVHLPRQKRFEQRINDRTIN